MAAGSSEGERKPFRKGYRARGSEARGCRLCLGFSREEFEAVKEAAGGNGMWPGSFAAAAVLLVVEADTPVVSDVHRGLLREVMSGNSLMRSVGRNLNQIARQFNASGTCPESLEWSLGLVGGCVERYEELAVRLDDLLYRR